MNQRKFEDSTSDKWLLKDAKFEGTCEQCGEKIPEGAQQYMRPEVADDGRKIWHVVHAFHGEPA